MLPSTAIVVMMVLMVWVIIMTGLRFWILRHHTRSRHDYISDFFVVLTVLLLIILVSLVTNRVSTLIGVSDPMQQQLLNFTPLALKIQFASSIVYTTNLWTIKAAFLSFYWGLFKRIHGFRNWILIGAICLTASAFIVAEVGNLAWCRPISNNWPDDPLVYAACAPAASTVWPLVAAIVNILNDIVVLAVPLSILPTLQIKRRELIALAFVFAVGVMSVAAAVARIVIVQRALVSAQTSQDTSLTIQIWSVAELAVGAVAFTLPSFRVLFVKWRRQNGSDPSTHGVISANISHGKITRTVELELEENSSEERLHVPQTNALHQTGLQGGFHTRTTIVGGGPNGQGLQSHSIPHSMSGSDQTV